MNDFPSASPADPRQDPFRGAAIPVDSATPLTLAEVFLRQCQERSAKRAYVDLGGDLQILREVTFGQLERNVRALAGALADEAPVGSCVLIALHGGIDSAEALWAAILAGLIPIPAPAADASLFHETSFLRLQAIAKQSGAKLVIASARDLARLGTQQPPGWTSLEALRVKASSAKQLSRMPAPSALAYLQYTSGSTSTPRGVEITHANAVAQCAALKRALENHDDNAASLNWLPWFHDFGLIQGYLLPLYSGCTSYLLPTGAFIRRPLRWLEGISRFNVAYSGAPNTAYLAATRALARYPHWTADLSCWSAAICGAEPIRADTVQAFTDAFAPHGFRRESFFPAYGLAESVLGVTVKQAGTQPMFIDADAEALAQGTLRRADASARNVRRLVGSGSPVDCCAITIVHPETHSVGPPGVVGEIWVQGPSVGRAYFSDDEATRKTFNVALDPTSGHTFLRTGDLGAMLEGQLFVTGRLKDIIVINGRNLYPHDLELTAEKAHPEVREGGVIAFGVESGKGESAVLLVESIGALSEEEAGRLVDAVVARIGAEHGADVGDVVLLRRGTLKPTSSGKPRRAAAKQRYLTGDFDSERMFARKSEKVSPRGATELIIAEAWMDILGVHDDNVRANFFLLGGNSLHATQLASRLSSTLAVDVPISLVFEAPTIEELAKAVAALRLKETSSLWTKHRIATRTPKLAHDLSFSQERIWFTCQETPESSAYNMPLAIRMRGKLDAAALETALGDVIERHEVLRTTFSADAYGVVGRVLSAMPVKLRRTALPAFAAGRRGEALPQLLARLTQQPFDLAAGPLIRADLIELAPDDAVLLIVKHHLVGDQWSFAVLIRELAQYYRMRRGTGETALQHLGLQYSDYATWQRASFEDDRRAQEEAYWRRQLAELDPAILPSDRPPTSASAYRGARVRLDFSAELTERLTATGAKHAASLSMVLLAALKALIFRYTDKNDVAIGLPVANRHHSVSEALIGTFVNLLVLRTDVQGRLSISELLRRVRKTSLEAFAHQDMPFELLIRMLRQERHGDHSPLFQVMFNMINAPLGPVDFDGIDLARVEFDREAAQFDLSVTVDADHDHSISFEYATDLFDARTIKLFAARYMRLLEHIAAGGDGTLSDWQMMDTEERCQILGWGRGAPLELPAPTVTKWLQSSFERNRGPAVICDEGISTYEQLDELSSNIARALASRDIGRGRRVGICAKRSVEMLAAMLGIIRSGAAYVPLDPVNPPARLKHICTSAQLSLVLTSGVAADAFVNNSPMSCLSVTDAVREGRQASGVLAVEPDPHDPLYVLYTSGSTGQPKGVSVAQRSVVNLIASITRTPGFSRSDRVLAITPLGFDISVGETLLPLLVGGQLVLASEADTVDGAALIRLIDSHAATIAQATPTTWEMILRSGWNGSPSLKRAIVTGEALSERLAKALLSRVPEVWNLYGPTETTVWSTLDRVTPSDHLGISIGGPIHNTQVYVLDQHGNICAAGVDGELYIGGAGVSLGYYNAAALASERFVPDRYSGCQGTLYSTGDIVRWRPDGKLQYLRRADDQIKLRGFRIELSEIEAVLALHPSVDQAAVIVAPAASGEMRLVAYVVPRGGTASDISLGAHARSLLPPHMVPSHFVTTQALPVLSSGKLDRKALSALKPPNRDVAGGTSPRTAAERAMWTIWRDVLEVDSFGVEDNFFDLGGHSMLALRLVSRISTELDSRCTPTLLFQNPSVADLCIALRGVDEMLKSSLVALQPQGDAAPIFCICGINIYQKFADRLAPERPVYGMFVPSELEILADTAQLASPRLRVEDLAAEYLTAMRARQKHGPYHLLGISFGGLLAFEIAQQLQAEGEEVALLAMLDTILPRRRVDVIAHRALQSAKVLHQKGIVMAAQRLKHRANDLVALHRQSRPEGEVSPNIEDEQRIAVRNAIYYRAMLKYTVKPYGGRTLLFHALNSNIPDTSDRWRQLLPDLEVVPVPSDHLGLLNEPHVDVVAAKIIGVLKRSSRA